MAEDKKGLRLAAAQTAAAGGDVAANVARHVELIEAAAERQVDVLVFPELSLTGYVEPVRLAVDPEGQELAALREACRRHRVVAVAGAPVASERGLVLAAIAVDRRGEVAAVYAKQHLDGPEKGWFVPGESGRVLLADGGRLGLGICYDASFPEHARHLALAGAEAYLVSGAFPLGESDHRRTVYFPARALENTCYVVFANYVGRHGGFEYGGRSAVYGPDGRLLIETGADRPGLAIADLDPEKLRAARTAATMLADLKPAPPVACTVLG